MIRLVPLLALLACTEVPVAAGDAYRLVSIDGSPFPARATLRIESATQVSGTGPCNSYGGTMSGPMPRFGSLQITATEIACDDLAAEMVYFSALAATTQAEVTGSTLTFSNDAGSTLVFAQP